MVRTTFHVGGQLFGIVLKQIEKAQSCNSFKYLEKDRFFINLKPKEQNVHIYWYMKLTSPLSGNYFVTIDQAIYRKCVTNKQTQ